MFVPTVTAFSSIAIAVLLLYDIDRSRHQKNVAKLESAAASHAAARAVVS
jgi:hypothetical protein